MSTGVELSAAALDRAPFVTALLDTDGTIVWVNEAWRAFGRANGLAHPDDGVGLNYLAVADATDSDDDARRASAGIRAVLDGDQSTFSMEYPCHSPDERRWFRLHAVLVDAPETSDTRSETTAAGPSRVCLVTHQNITDPVERERLAERQRAELERLASMLSHDVRNPLAVAEGWIYLLGRDGAANPDAVAGIDDALGRIRTIIEDAVTLLRAGVQAADTESCSLTTGAHEAWGTVETTGARLLVESETVLDANRGLLRTVLENLFRNSVEHGSTSPHSQAREDSVEHGSTSSQAPPDDSVEYDPPTVRVRVGALASDEGFFVADDGAGIPPDLREDAFDFGFSTGEGSGLGLAIVDHIASLYDWSVGLGESVDGGARVEIHAGVTGD